MDFTLDSSTPTNPEKSHRASQELREPTSLGKTQNGFDGALPSSRQSSSRLHSSRASIAASTRSSIKDDIRHEVMCNYLYQQQCAKLWITDGSGQLEGVLVKKGRDEYISCPAALAHSDFAAAIATLNVPVPSNCKSVRLTTC